MSSQQQRQKALFLEAKFGQLVVKPAEVPQPASGDLLVKVEAAALNPIDWMIQVHGVFVDSFPALVGCDGAGIVVEVGDGVTAFTVGDRVSFQGGIDAVQKSIKGTFAQYVTTSAKFAAKVPNNISFEAASTIPCCFSTAALVLYIQDKTAPSAKLLPPWSDGGKNKYAGKSALVIGGASSVGQYVIQLTHLSGFSPIIATASPHNADFLKTLGATHVIDRTLSADSVQAEAMKIAGDLFNLVYDAVSVPETIPIGYALTASDGDFVVVSPPGSLSDDEKSKKKIHMAHGLLSIPHNYDAGVSLLAALPKLLETGDIKPNRVELLHGGLNAIADGLERLKKNEVSGVKLVVRPQETA